MKKSTPFLENLLAAPGPSGFETRAARVWRDEARRITDDIELDANGNSMAALRAEQGPTVMMAGHIDEIGLQVTHIDENGIVYIAEIGGWDAQVLVGQRVRLLAKNHEVPGVIGRKAIHLMEADDRTKAVRTKDLWVDLGATSAEEVAELGVRVGDPMVLDQPVLFLAGDRIASRAIDNRIGAFVVLEALRLLAADEQRAATAVAVATAQEEIGYHGGGARSSAFTLQPDVALVVDVTFATDVPDVPKKELGDHRVGGGPVLSRGSAAHPVVFERLVEVAEREGIPYSIQAQPKATHTDADGIHLTRSGVPTGLVSVPNRYMHSPNEIVSLSDLHHTAHLLAAFVRSLEGGADFRPD
jgi:endoglucanase